MGKRIGSQRKGRGGIQFRSNSKGKLEEISYPLLDINTTHKAVIENLLREKGRFSPLMKIRLDNNIVTYLPAPTGISVNDEIYIGTGAPLRTGCILPLGKIPEGTVISNIEKIYGDGGKYVKAAGASAIVLAHVNDKVIIKMPSGKKMESSGDGRAMVGVIAGGGRMEKPFLIAGRKWHYMRSKSKKYPTVRGIAMASVYHPHGGGRHQHPGKPTTVSRNTPPGRKVGNIAARKTGTKRILDKNV